MLGRWGRDPLFAVARNQRYRAKRRHEVRAAAQVVALLVIAVLVLDLVTLGPRAPIIFPVNIVEIALLLILRLLVRGPLRRHPQPVTVAIGIVAVAGTVIPFALDDSLAYALLAYTALIILGSALFVPWSPGTHVSWLLICLTIVAAVVASPLGARLDANSAGLGTRDLAMTSLASALISLAGYVVVELRRLRSLAVELQVRALHERTRDQRAELLRLNRELAIVARTDPLTGTGNRVRLREDAARLTAPSEPDADGRRPVRAAALIDLDRFKRYNDRYGHLGGDDVLRQVAIVISSLRDSDAYRFGGEEFLVVAPFASADDVGPAFDGLRRAVEALDIAHADSHPWNRMTISLGVDVRETAHPINLEAWIRRADLALYEAKAAGRNQLKLVRPDGTAETWAADSLVGQASA